MPNVITWFPGDGSSSVLLTTDPNKVIFGEVGYLMPPTAQLGKRVPVSDGDRFESQNYLPRVFDIPVLMKDLTRALHMTNVRNLAKKFNPGSGEGRIRYAVSDGTTREIFCRYIAGFGGNYGDSNAMPTWEKAIFTFKANDPFFWEISQTSTQFTLASDPVSFFPFFPFVLTASEIFMSSVINNLGDVEAWPIFVIEGPGVNPTLKNITSGKTITLTVILVAGESITIDTRPLHKTIIKSDGSNLFSTMQDTSTLWPLKAGNNSIQLTMSGADANSFLNLAYTPRYLTI